ncbi:hypothetical protein [Paraglaciecola arctica]|uniref:hypothetical protein n=1 Tax=Paraglaciecola arctica TaxID=1128911 RepID=UPI001C06C5AE|nr:hypothetical protein [Paraglaciecola arctica]MBU3001840.1 hypothetical protein [Paraglaciecola arctica]
MKLTTIALFTTLAITSATAHAEGSSHHSGQASKHSVLAVGHGALSTAKVASAVVAVPLVVTGSLALKAGAASVQTGAIFADSANTHTRHRSLVITETTITADPAPDQVIIIKNKRRVITH